MKKILPFLFVFVSLLFTSSFPQSGQWQWLHQSPQGNLIRWVKVWDANNWYAVGYGGVFMKTSNAGISWTVNQNASKVVTASLTPSNLNSAWFFDQNTGFVVGDNSTVELTTDGGTTFNLVSGIPAPASSPATNYYGIFFQNSMNGWIGGSGGNTSRFIQTTDGGITWTANAALGSTTYNDIWSPDGQIIVLATPSANIVRSTNGGTSWTTINVSGVLGSFYKLSFSNSTTGMAVGGSASGGSPSVAVTTDAGVTWTNVVPAAITGVNSLRDVDYYGGTFYVTGVHSPAPVIYQTTDLGVTWTTLNFIAPGQTYLNRYYGCDINAGVILVGGNDGMLNSVIGGANTCYTANVKQGANKDIWGNASGRIIAVGAATTGLNDQIMLSTNGGNTWSFPINTIATATILNSLKMVDDNIGYTCSNKGGVYKTTDGGNTWTTLTTSPTIPATHNLVKVDFINTTTGWVFDANGDPGGSSTAAIWKTTDGGSTWTRQSYSDGGAYSYVYLAHASMVDANVGWALPNNGGPWKTTDGGTTWTQQSLPTSGVGRNIKMLDASNGYISGNNGNLWKTTNGGTTWTLVTLPVQGSSTANLLAMYWKNVNIGMVSATGSALYTTNGGATWSYKVIGGANFAGTITNNSIYFYNGPDWTSALIAANEGGVYLDANDALLPVELSSFVSTVQGRTINLSWTTQTEKNSDRFEVERTLTSKEVWSTIGSVKASVLSNSPKSYSYTDTKLQPGKYQYRLKMIDNDGSFSYSTVTEAVVGSPKDFAISQNYPNPFNPSTRISYDLPVDSRVSIELYSITGQKVASLVNKQQTAGYYTVDVNAGILKLTSGVYIYRINAGNAANKESFVQVKKMIFLK